jgi:NAD(P)-dependent dehydrogenase (short-subunit alcohol dehydrogenase family)
MLLYTLYINIIQLVQLDLCDFASVREFAKTVRSMLGRDGHLHMLINNAGQIQPGLAENNMSITFTANYLGEQNNHVMLSRYCGNCAYTALLCLLVISYYAEY